MAKLEKVQISLQYSLKANLGNFESGEARIGREEIWDVSDMSQEDADLLYESRRQILKQELETIVQNEYKEMLGK